MSRVWLLHTVLRAASLLAPPGQRAEWLKGWRSELWYIPQPWTVRFCLGAFRDANWVRRNSERPERRAAFWFDSPVSCLAFLALVAAVSGIVAVCLPAPDATPAPAHLDFHFVAGSSVAMFLLSFLTFPDTRLAMRSGCSRHRSAPWPGQLRRGIFLLLKFALVLPVMLLGFVALIWTGPRVPFAPPLAYAVLGFLTFRWVLLDQRNRCPVCLRPLTDPVRIGAPSQTFLEWYGSESMCPRGHGLLQISEMPASYSAAEWHRLDDSWSGLFSPALEVRQR